ncbi:ABC transporter ATP-binding protein/permease [Paenibacillus motobuensis]|uniref:ABC transporter ATP-binding protein n=1 Tax=Paenibacillus TaxID=44249 RepID=UPI0020418713|nr:MULTISPECIES: ABC transporter ATP-binding protein [Paenibacillus]MCM3042932.1 ABC transporter ATP-binding protein/permease [Paenibacillus lutimineralis]MCM3650036.1 ABC transporter ATP-binding protein/permease [Paenibacillus motobuensis]
MVFSFMKKYWIAATAAFCMMLLELSVELVQPLIISKIIDDGIAQRQLSVAWTWGAVLVGSAFIAFAGGIASSFFASHASQGFGYDLRDKLYEKVEGFSYSVFNRFATSSLITRLTGDITQMQDMLFMSLRFASRVPLVVFGSMVMALVVHAQLGIFLTVLIPVLIVFVYRMIKRISVQFRAVQQRLDGLNGVIQENLLGMRLIRVFVRRNHEINRFDQRSKELMDGTVRALRSAETTMPFILFVMNLGILAVLWFGRIDIAAGSASVGQVVAVVNYSLRTIGALSALSWIMTSYSRAAASAQRVNEVLLTEDDSEETHTDQTNKPNLEGRVEFSTVSFRYPDSEMNALENISFQIEPGQRVAIMGATGSGKSSLVQLIPRLYEPSNGIIKIDGIDIADIDSSRLRGSIGYVPQEIMLFSGTVRENIAWGREDASLEEIEEAAKQAQIHDTIKSLTHGYGTMIGQRGVNLSGGQKQRLSIARALVRRPSILILDDSTSALDMRTEAALMQALNSFSCTTFLITQKISSTVSADLILLLDEGRLIASGTHDQLMTESSLYRRIVESQHREGEEMHVQRTR